MREDILFTLLPCFEKSSAPCFIQNNGPAVGLVKHKLEKLIDPERDSLRFYNLGNNYSGKICHIGVKESYDAEEVLMI